MTRCSLAHAGLLNLGETCYLNATIQALFHCPGFVKCLDKYCCHDGKGTMNTCIACALSLLQMEMARNKLVSPTHLVGLVPVYWKTFVVGEQQDAHEYLATLLSKMQEAQQRTYLEHKYGRSKITDLNATFGGSTHVKDVCSLCNFEWVDNPKFHYLCLPLPKNVAMLQKAVDLYFSKTEIITSKCPNCNKISERSRTERMGEYPQNLIVLLKRFTVDDNFNQKKIMDPIEVNPTLTVGEATYKFCSGVIHTGDAVTNGHYIGLSMCPDGSFTRFNDSAVWPKCVAELKSGLVTRGLYIAIFELHAIKRAVPLPSVLVTERPATAALIHSKRPVPVTPSKRSPPMKRTAVSMDSVIGHSPQHPQMRPRVESVPPLISILKARPLTEKRATKEKPEAYSDQSAQLNQNLNDLVIGHSPQQPQIRPQVESVPLLPSQINQNLKTPVSPNNSPAFCHHGSAVSTNNNIGHTDTGLVNDGMQQPFTNAVLQVLFHVPQVVQYLDEDKDHRESCNSFLNCITCSLFRLFNSMRSQHIAQPNLFLCRWTNSKEINTPILFLLSILEGIALEFLDRDFEFLTSKCSTVEAPINNLFLILKEVQGVCSACNTRAFYEQKNYIVSIGTSMIHKEVTEQLDFISPTYCTECHGLETGECASVSLPPYLFVSVERNTTEAPVLQLKLKGEMYSLVAYISGSSHKAYTICPDARMRSFQDSEVVIISLVTFISSWNKYQGNSCICLYKREDYTTAKPKQQRNASQPAPKPTRYFKPQDHLQQKSFVKKKKSMENAATSNSENVSDEECGSTDDPTTNVPTKSTQTPVPTMKDVACQVNFLDYSRCTSGNIKNFKFDFKFFTGISIEDFELLYALIGGDKVIESLSYKYQDLKKKIQKEENLKIGFKDRLFMFLIRLRRGLPLEELSLIAGLGVSWTGEICYTMTRLVFLTLKSLETKCFPSAAQQKLTKSVQMFPFKNLRVILDGVEFRIETPSNFQMQGNTYSQYKAGNTMRVIVGVDSNGGTVFVSPGCEGGLSEKEAVLRSGLLERLQKGDLVMTDRGFEITAELQAIGVHHVKPPSLGSRNSLTAEEEILTKAIAAVRIYSEHAMADIKDNRLLRGTIPLKLYPVLPDLVYIAAYLRNFSPKRIIDKSFRQNSNQKE